MSARMAALTATPVTRRETVASRQILYYGGLKIRVGPDFWPRRFLPFLPYIESHNPSFRIDIKCLAEPTDPWEPNATLDFQVRFEDGSAHDLSHPNPLLKVGGTKRFTIPFIHSGGPGRVVIAFPIEDPKSVVWTPLYTYEVYSEGRLWLFVLALLSAVVGAALREVSGRLL